MTETVCIGGLEKSWSKVTVHLDTSADNLIRTIPKTSVLPLFQWKRRVDLNAKRQIKQSHVERIGRKSDFDAAGKDFRSESR